MLSMRSSLIQLLRTGIATVAMLCVMMSSLGLHLHIGGHSHPGAHGICEAHDHGDHHHQDAASPASPSDLDDDHGDHHEDHHEDSCWHVHGSSVISLAAAQPDTADDQPPVIGVLTMVRTHARPDSCPGDVEPAPDKRFL
jgi:hypothetical protein